MYVFPICRLGGVVPYLIEEAISEAIVLHEGISDQQARDFVCDVKSEGRWVVEAYSSRITKNLDMGIQYYQTG